MSRHQVADTDVNMLSQLQERDKQIIHLEHLLTTMQEQIQIVSTQLRFVAAHTRLAVVYLFVTVAY